MAFVPVANTVLAEMRMTLDLQQVENTLWFEFPAAPAVGEMTELGERLITWWGSFYAPLVVPNLQLREVVVTDMTSATAGQATVVPAAPLVGSNSDDALPSNVSLTVSFRTASRGRSFRGRNYIVGMADGQTTGPNTVISSVITDWIEAYTELLTVGSSIDATWVIVSRFSGIDSAGKPIPRAAGITTPVTTVTIVDNIVDSQRRRLPGRGN